ncbi:MAG TPA: hypothetical protein VG755_12995 [Nannocystaceae bacterium]|nr:hypothetical protein [Nannocystaceae bacterium]
MDSDPARAALAAFREATACSAELRAENLRRIEARLHGQSQGAAARSNRGIGIVVAVLAAAAVAVLVARGMTRETVAERAGAGRSQASDDVKVEAGSVAVPPVMTTAPAPAPTPTPTPTPTPVEQRSRQRGAVRAEPAAPEDLLAREAAALKAAREALARGELDVAARELAALDRELPQGELLEERRMLAQRLRCARGDTSACTKSP